MRAYFHGDIDLDDPGHYYCHHHKTTHPVKGMQKGEWCDLYYSLHHAPIDDISLRKPTHPNLWRELARRPNGQSWRPYPGAPHSWACDVAARGSGQPLSVLLTTAETILEPFPGSYEALRDHVFVNVPDLRTPPKETRLLIYFHGDIKDDTYYCQHCNLFIPLPSEGTLPLLGDVRLLRQSLGKIMSGAKSYRPANAPSIWKKYRGPGMRGRPRKHGDSDYLCQASR